MILNRTVAKIVVFLSIIISYKAVCGLGYDVKIKVLDRVFRCLPPYSDIGRERRKLDFYKANYDFFRDYDSDDPEILFTELLGFIVDKLMPDAMEVLDEMESSDELMSSDYMTISDQENREEDKRMKIFAGDKSYITLQELCDLPERVGVTCR